MSKEQSSEELLNGVARRDSAALGELYDRFAPRLYGLIAHIVPSPHAEQILQEIFQRLWSKGPALREAGGSVAAWLVVSARAMAIERCRAADSASEKSGAEDIDKSPTAGRQKARKARGKSIAGKSEALNPYPANGASRPAFAPIPLSWLPHPQEIALIDDRLMLLQKAIDRLPKSQRQALDLAVYGGRSEAEIAVATGEPLGKAQRSLRAAIIFVKHRRQAVSGTWAANI